MESKKNKAMRLLKKNDNLLTCPVCSENLFACHDFTLKCSHRHSFDISKKGVINLWGKDNSSLYDSALFLKRREIIRSGYYDQFIMEICRVIRQYKLIDTHSARLLDAGCGEGSFTHMISGEINPELSTGIDISKPGIELATSCESDIIWVIDDIANMHFSDKSIDIILNILSPAGYNRFNRIITDDGIIVKVIPGKNYLREIREVISDNNIYDNSDTAAHASKGMEIIHDENVEYILSITEDCFRNFMEITPMTNMFRKKFYDESGIQMPLPPLKKAYELTIDLRILVGKPY